MKHIRKLFRIIFGRTAFVVLALLLQIAILVTFFLRLENYMHIVYVVSLFLSAVVIIYIFNEPINSSFKLAWIVPVLVIPVFGVLLYLFVQLQPQTKFTARQAPPFRADGPAARLKCLSKSGILFCDPNAISPALRDPLPAGPGRPKGELYHGT